MNTDVLISEINTYAEFAERLYFEKNRHSA